jgi:splicing factor 3B subunit 1
MSKQENYKKPV